jgi:hypothetical protein
MKALPFLLCLTHTHTKYVHTGNYYNSGRGNAHHGDGRGCQGCGRLCQFCGDTECGRPSGPGCCTSSSYSSASRHHSGTQSGTQSGECCYGGTTAAAFAKARSRGFRPESRPTDDNDDDDYQERHIITNRWRRDTTSPLAKRLALQQRAYLEKYGTTGYKPINVAS